MSSIQSRSSRPVANWIYIGIAMLLIQVVLGGITRLTGSGLSITEWNVVTGALPPLSEQKWLTEFDKYKETPQFRYLNMDFTLSDFKFIFFWEWFHRFWARLIGVVFVVGFVYLVARKHLRKEMRIPLIILFLLGALQGAIGWIMVASGLTGDALYVKPTKLAMHFVLAIGLIAYAFWFALQLSVRDDQRDDLPKLKKFNGWILFILGLQLVYGALMAGHKAATAAPTWPDINGSMVPDGLLREQPMILNFFENLQTVHFVHRGLAYLLLVLIIFLSWRISRIPRKTATLQRLGHLPLTLVLIQAVLGIVAVLISPGIVPGKWAGFEWTAQLHQVVGMLLVLSLIAIWYLSSGKSFNQKSII